MNLDTHILSGIVVALKRAVWFRYCAAIAPLPAKAVEGAPLPLESVDNVHGSDGLAFGMLTVCHCIANDIFQENLQHPSGLFVDEARNSLDSSSSCKSSDGWFGDALDVITQDLAMTFCASLSQTLSSFATARHDELDRIARSVGWSSQMLESYVLIRPAGHSFWVCVADVSEATGSVSSRGVFVCTYARTHARLCIHNNTKVDTRTHTHT